MEYDLLYIIGYTAGQNKDIKNINKNAIFNKNVKQKNHHIKSCVKIKKLRIFDDVRGKESVVIE